MGDIADYYLMTCDPFEDEWDEGYCTFKTCNFCGEGSLHWRYSQGGWILCDVNERKHFCDPPLPDVSHKDVLLDRG
jgi:hypothetical protein